MHKHLDINPLIKFVTSRNITDIEEIEVERETDKSVWIRGSRSDKQTEWNQYHNTYDDAYLYLEVKYKYELERAETRLKIAKENYETVIKHLICSGLSASGYNLHFNINQY